MWENHESRSQCLGPAVAAPPPKPELKHEKYTLILPVRRKHHRLIYHQARSASLCSLFAVAPSRVMPKLVPEPKEKKSIACSLLNYLLCVN
jgi:hypothetical protein